MHHLQVARLPLSNHSITQRLPPPTTTPARNHLPPRAANSNLAADLSAANVEIGALTSSINSVADCTTGTCVPRIPTCNFSSLTGASMTATGLVASVSTTVSPGVCPLGATIIFSAAPGYYLAAGAATQTTCHDPASGGWSNPVPAVSQCMANCNMCTTGSDCQQCADG
jgi:hypothetical protein